MNIFVLIGYVFFGTVLYLVSIEIFTMTKTKNGWKREKDLKDINKIAEDLEEAYRQD